MVVWGNVRETQPAWLVRENSNQHGVVPSRQPQSLPRQVKQLLYGPARRQRLGAATGDSAAIMEEEQESALLSELAEGDFSADQNIVEVSLNGRLAYRGSGTGGV